MIHTFDGLVATKKIHSVYMQAKDLKLKTKTMDDLLKVHTITIKEYMAEDSVLYCPKGGEIVTYKHDKAEEVDVAKLKTFFPSVYKACLTELNKKMLKESFPEAYEACVVIGVGSRKFVLK